MGFFLKNNRMGGFYFEFIKKGFILVVNWRGGVLKFFIEKFWRVLFEK